MEPKVSDHGNEIVVEFYGPITQASYDKAIPGYSLYCAPLMIEMEVPDVYQEKQLQKLHLFVGGFIATYK